MMLDVIRVDAVVAARKIAKLSPNEVSLISRQ
jgi:hypothetical protein